MTLETNNQERSGIRATSTDCRKFILRLEIEERDRRASGPDPRLPELEAENKRLRQELAGARAAQEEFEDAVAAVVERLSLD